MSRELRTIGSFATPVEADAFRLRLEAEGIRSVLADEAIVGMNWMLGNAVGGVKVLVADDDFVRAYQAVLAVAAAADDHAQDSSSSPDWKCRLCGEGVSAEFDVCWACGASREGQADPNFENESWGEVRDRTSGADADAVRPNLEPPAGAISHPPDAPGDEWNPYRSPTMPLGDAPADEQAAKAIFDFSEDDEIAFRAWKASIIGLAFYRPLFQLYSTALLVSIAFSERQLSPKAAQRYVVAWIINVTVVGTAGALLAWALLRM